MMNTDQTSLRTMRLLAALEATTLVVLVLVAVPIKHLAQQPGLVSVMGPVHGIAFLAYMWALTNAAASKLLPAAEVWKLFIAALVPFGGFMSVAWLARREEKT